MLLMCVPDVDKVFAVLSMDHFGLRNLEQREERIMLFQTFIQFYHFNGLTLLPILWNWNLHSAIAVLECERGHQVLVAQLLGFDPMNLQHSHHTLQIPVAPHTPQPSNLQPLLRGEAVLVDLR